ncbi:interleukin-33-like isoform X2 [Ornithorhynchus anatinus]|uniref:interleukin-33-like isoform X2 n=1 Tax=Ornithorhynchus anatinus TaxID=9258 RepID=UPI0010A8A823|nr:interleukin-33-like isoform X2 [Ornithorhynchus anatinus]
MVKSSQLAGLQKNPRKRHPNLSCFSTMELRSGFIMRKTSPRLQMTIARSQTIIKQSSIAIRRSFAVSPKSQMPREMDPSTKFFSRQLFPEDFAVTYVETKRFYMTTANGKHVSFVRQNEDLKMHVKHAPFFNQKDEVLIEFFKPQASFSSGETIVALSCKFTSKLFLLHANGSDVSLKLQNQEKNREKQFFILHPEGSEYFLFEFFSQQGHFLCAKARFLELCSDIDHSNEFMFKLTNSESSNSKDIKFGRAGGQTETK